MKGKIVLITGATNGIGKATALALARLGATVILHGRNIEKTKSVQQELIACSGNPHIDILIADLYLLADVRKMSAAFYAKYDHLDVLINNAGALLGNKREVTAEGYEKTITINLLTPFLLMGLLFGALQKSKAARIINVASSAQKQSARPDFNDMQSLHQYAPFTAYGNAKLFLILASQHFDKKLKELSLAHITINTLHPGAVASAFSTQSDLGGFLKIVSKIARPFLKSAQQGADTIIYLASSPEVKGISGNYYINRKKATVNRKYNTAENEQIVWTYCSQQTSVSVFQ